MIVFDPGSDESAQSRQCRPADGEDCKVSIRKARHEALDMLSEMKSAGDASEDDVERAKKKAEEIVSEGGSSVDQTIATKEKEILVV